MLLKWKDHNLIENIFMMTWDRKKKPQILRVKHVSTNAICHFSFSEALHEPLGSISRAICSSSVYSKYFQLISIACNAVFPKSQNQHDARTLVFVRPIIIGLRTPLIMMRGRPSTKWCWGLTDSDQLGLRGSPKNHRIYWNKYFFISNSLCDYLCLMAVWNLPYK